MKTQYFGVIGNRDFIKHGGERLPYWRFLDEQPDGWLSSLAYEREDLPDMPTIMDCGAWSYKHERIPPVDADSVIAKYTRLSRPGSILIAPDHMLIDGVDHEFRRRWNRQQAERFLITCPADYRPMACIHGQTIDERVEHALKLVSMGYRYLAVGGVAARASQKTLVLATVAALREATQGAWLHVLGLSSPSYIREWRRIGVESCDGSSHFKQAFTAGTFFTVHDGNLKSHKAARPGEQLPDIPECDCTACRMLREDGIDTRFYGSNESNMGRAAHNQNMLMRAHRFAMRWRIGLVACCGEKKSGAHPAADLYQSPLFKKSRAWVEKKCDEWLILSAKYGVVRPDEIIESYDMTLNDMSSAQRREWDARVKIQLSIYAGDRLTVLAGNTYCGWTGGFDVERPLAGLGIGQQLQWLTKEITHASKSNQKALF